MNKVIKEFKKDLEQIETSEASGGREEDVPKEAWNDGGEFWIVEKKFDGTRLLMHITSEGQRLTTRRISEKTGKLMERSNNAPHFRDLDLKELEGTVLDGEGLAPVEEDTMGATQSIIGSSPEKSWMRQEEIGLLEYHVFDIVKYKGKDLRNLPYKERHTILSAVLIDIWKKYPKCQIIETAQVHIGKKEFYKSEIARGQEGVMVKSQDSVYGDIHGLIKVKSFIRFTMLITGFKDGAGKHEGKVGSVGVGFYGEPQLTYAGGISDVLRQDMKDHPEEYLGKIVEVECQMLTKTGSLRHPRIVGSQEDRKSTDLEQEKLRIFRLDKRPEDCTRGQNNK